MYLSFLFLFFFKRVYYKSLCNATQFSGQINVMDPKELGSPTVTENKTTGGGGGGGETHQKTVSTKNLYKNPIVFFSQINVAISS